MLKKKFLIVPVLVSALFLMSSVLMGTLVSAQSFRSGDAVSTASNKVIDQSLYAAGKTLTIESTINGDLFCAGQTVLISGEINGDVICAAQNITISGRVNGDIRIASQTFTLSSTVTGNASIAGETFIQNSTSVIEGDLSIGGSDVTLNGKIGRDVALGSNLVTVNGSIGRNIIGEVENLKLLPGSSVAGKIDYKSRNEISQDKDAKVLGEVSRSTPDKKEGPSLFGISVWFMLFIFFGSLLIALALILIAPRFFNSVSERALPKPWKALLAGIVLSILAPVVLGVLLISYIGIPLAIVLGVAWLLATFLSTFFTAYLIGRWILQISHKPILIMLPGSAVLSIVIFVPIIGFIVFLLAYWIGIGMLALELYSRNPRPSYNFSDTAKSASNKVVNKKK